MAAVPSHAPAIHAAPRSRYDVCVIGGGPAGSTTAGLLARKGLSVALVDRARFPRDKTCGDGITPRGARVLQRIGMLDAVAREGFLCRGLEVRGHGIDDEPIEFSLPFSSGAVGEPSDLIVLPRFALDQLLLSHAMKSGPALFEDTKAVGVESHPGHARVLLDEGEPIDASLVVLATGAESQLLRACGILASKPPVEHAARAYFDGVEGLTDRVVLFFDGVDLPGYGWIFPTSATSANIGCGVFAQSAVEGGKAVRPMPQAQRLEQLLATHPLLVRMLARATRRGPVRAYPLRTDFHRDFAGRGRMIVVGEAAGLVNPITGEGIDYALESAEFVAASIERHWSPSASGAVDDSNASRILEHYRARLSKRFTTRFALYRTVQRHALSPTRMPALLTQASRATALQQLVVDGLFGRARPAHLFRPRTLWQVARVLLRTATR